MIIRDKELGKEEVFQHEGVILAESCNTITDIADTVARIGPRLAMVNLRMHAMVDRTIRHPLTGLFTRRYLEDSLERELLRADVRHTSLAIAILSLDNFQRFSAECGVPAANILLEATAQLLTSRIRRLDLACHYRTEEFAFVLLDASATVARSRAEELRAAMKSLPWCHNATLAAPVTLSAGVAAYPDHALEAACLVRAAEFALRQAVAKGSDRVIMAPPCAVAAA